MIKRLNAAFPQIAMAACVDERAESLAH